MHDFSITAQLRAYADDRRPDGGSKTYHAPPRRDRTRPPARPTAAKILAVLAGDQQCRTAHDLHATLGDVGYDHIAATLRHLTVRGDIVRLPPDRQSQHPTSHRYTISRGDDYDN
jgi:hypothetical protein